MVRESSEQKGALVRICRISAEWGLEGDRLFSVFPKKGFFLCFLEKFVTFGWITGTT